MTFVCLGWGSLIWRPEDLPTTEWKPDGPVLLVEFARISSRGRVTLVLVDGVPALPVLWSPMRVESLHQAVTALAARERTPPEDIGRWTAQGDSSYPFSEIISQWATGRGFQGVVWAALKPGFPSGRGRTPKLSEVLAHLEMLQGDERAAAVEYVKRAPKQIKTSNRSAIEAKLGLTAAAEARPGSAAPPGPSSPAPAAVSNDKDPAGTPALFFETLGTALKSQAGIDGPLADILVAHLLTARQALDAVDTAFKEIVSLAEERAAQSGKATHG